MLRDSSQIIEKAGYLVTRSLRNPDFQWGNFLIFKQAPSENDIPTWEEHFCREFPEFIHQHRAFTWIKGEVPSNLKTPILFRKNGLSKSQRS